MPAAARRRPPYRSVTPVLILALGLAAVSGCGDDDGAAPPAVPAGTFVGVLECRVEEAAPAAETLECVVWDYDRTSGLLTLQHTGANLNCCPEREPQVVRDDGAVTLVEDGVGGLCDCQCLYDLVYELADVPPVSVTVTVRPAAPPAGLEPLAGVLDLAAEDAGAFCVPRTGYPWGP